MRLDVYLAENGLAKSRESAKEKIKAGRVTVDGAVVTKPAFEVSDSCTVEVAAGETEYVGRGGLKLEKALRVFRTNLSERVCLDIGASTGGFSDCMLRHGAAFVYAVDVGTGQLDEALRQDERVRNMERTNILDLSPEDFFPVPTFVAADVSFVSLRKILPKIAELGCDGVWEGVLLIKPQFEAGRKNIGKGGIVKDRAVHAAVLADIADCCGALGLGMDGLTHSPVTGGDGNIEYLAHIEKGAVSRIYDYKKIVGTAFNELKKGDRA